MIYARCPKCDHAPLPVDQSASAECPACGVILAKAGQRPTRAITDADAGEGGLRQLIWHLPERVDAMAWKTRIAILVVFAFWGLRLCWLDYRDGEIMNSFLHGPLLLFHEAGHVIFRPFGEWVAVLGGTLGQLLMPAILCGALLWKSRDPFGAAIGLWLFGVSVLDVSPYMYDALHPQLVLLNGATGEAGGHDWIYLFDSLHQLAHAQRIGAFTHALGVAVVLVALLWAATVLRLQRRRVAGNVLFER